MMAKSPPVGIVSYFTKERSQAAMSASAKARHNSEFAQELWNHDPLDLMDVAQFEQFLSDKFGPEYLEPVQYVREGDTLVPAYEVIHAKRNDLCDGCESATGSRYSETTRVVYSLATSTSKQKGTSSCADVSHATCQWHI